MERESFMKQALAKAAKYCASGERAPSQVLSKFSDWGLSDTEAQHLLGILVSEKYVSEERFARAYCRDKFSFNKWGKRKIRQELMRLRISEEEIHKGLSEIDPEKYELTLQHLASQKWKTTKGDDWTRKQKTAAYLVGKGFEMDLTMAAVDDLSSGIHSDQ